MEFTNNDLGYAVAKELFSRDILISGTYINARVLRIEPPLVITNEQLDHFLKMLVESIQAVMKEHKLGDVVTAKA